MKTDIDTDWIIPSSHHRLSAARPLQQAQVASRPGRINNSNLLKFWNLFRILFWEEKEEKGGRGQGSVRSDVGRVV